MITAEDLAQAILELKKSQEKTDEQMKKTDEELNKLLKSHKALGKMVGGIANNQGDIAEEFFYNSLKAKPSMAGINYDFIDKNVTRSKNKIEDENEENNQNEKNLLINYFYYSVSLSTNNTCKWI